MGLLIGNTQNPVTLQCDSGNFEQVNAYASLNPEITFNRDQQTLQMTARYNKTKADKEAGKRGFCPDVTGSVVTVPCTLAELDAETGQPLFVVAYAKFKAWLKERLATENIFDDVPAE